MTAARLPFSRLPENPNVCVVYATLGRAETLSATFAAIARQTIPPASVIVSSPSVADAGAVAGAPGAVGGNGWRR